jgi:Second Messenger Oligonucleotide or Dinucleotide Synthetase domain
VATAISNFPATSFLNSLDEVLFEVCDEIQLNETRHALATQRYLAVGGVLESESSPFKMLRPKIFPQGSMALGTTVKPVEGPHDLDFVLELSASHTGVDPMALIDCLFRFLKSNGVYAGMTELKNRCVRLVYADDSYMDILPGRAVWRHLPERPRPSGGGLETQQSTRLHPVVPRSQLRSTATADSR